jgi:hypothetical protein
VPGKGKGIVVPLHAMNAYGGMEVLFHSLLTLTIYGEEWSALCPGSFMLGTHQRGGWVGPIGDLDASEKRNICCLCQESKHVPDRPVSV